MPLSNDIELKLPTNKKYSTFLFSFKTNRPRLKAVIIKRHSLKMIGSFLYHIPHQTPPPPPHCSYASENLFTILISRYITGIFLPVFDPSFAVLTLVFFRCRPLIRVRCSIENKRLTLSTHKFLTLPSSTNPHPPFS